jgi:hypothetical protein
VDVYEPGSGIQLNDFNPGIEPSGLFWTMAIPPESVEVGFEEGSASMRVNNVSVLDYGDFTNALFGGGPKPKEARLSFVVRWSGRGKQVKIVNPAQGFKGNYIRNQAQMKWAATVGDFTYVSDPIRTSSSVFAELGRERNGSFFLNDDEDDREAERTKTGAAG